MFWKVALLGVVWVNFGGQDTFQGLLDGLQCASGPPVWGRQGRYGLAP